MPDRPNVLWITMEDTSPRFGCYGDDVARTPNIDALAAEGRRYTNAFSTAPVCAPSRSAAVTGCYQNTLGTHHMRTTHTNDDAPGLATPYDAVPPHYVRTVSEYFRGAGYYCTNNVKTDYQFGEPFTAWDDHHDEAGWWGRDDDDRPFFAAFNNTVTHESGMWPPEERAALLNEVGKDSTDLPTEGSLTTDPDAVEVPPYLPDTDETRRTIARQYENVHASDAWVGRLLDRLAEDGLAENTIVVLWSDHGEGLSRAKRWPYDSGINVPLVVRWPGEVEGGEQSDRLVSMVDLAPTLLSACGLDVPRYMQGRSFLADDEREYVYASRDRYDESYDAIRVVRDQRYKYVRHYRPGEPYRQWIPFRNRHPAMRELLRRDAAGELEGAERWVAADRPAEELYDLQRDPHETENLADDPEYETELVRLRAALDEWIDRADAFVAEDEAAMVRRRHPDEATTATPTFVPNAPGNRERRATPDGADLDGPATVSIHCSTQGASIGYTTDTGEDPHWELYTGPIPLPEGETTVRAKAIRYGFEESDERMATFTVSDRSTGE